MPIDRRPMPHAALLALALASCHAGPSASDSAAGGADGKADGVSSLRFAAPSTARRGPVELAFAVGAAPVDPAALRLELRTADGWTAASTLGAIRDTDEGLAVTWDSFADVEADGRVSLRLSSSRAALAFAVSLRNAPDADRLVATGHPLVATPSGGRERGRAVSLVRWDGRSGGVVGERRRVDVGAGPRVVRASPDGRFLAVLARNDGTVSLLRTPLDASPGSVTVEPPVRLPGGAPMDLQFTSDGRRLLVPTGGDDENAPALWAIDVPAGDGPFEWMEQLAVLPGPPMRLAVDAAGRSLVFCGSGGQGLDKLLLLDAEGQERARLEADMAVPNALAFSPDGARAVVTSTFYGDEVRLLDTDGDRLEPVGAPLTTLASPYGVLFHPSAPGVGLVSQVDKNRATPFTLVPGLRTGVPLTGLGLAGELDVVRRGPQEGVVFATGVAGSEGVLHVLRLSDSGRLAVERPAIVLGTGAEEIPTGLAVQR